MFVVLLRFSDNKEQARQFIKVPPPLSTITLLNRSAQTVYMDAQWPAIAQADERNLAVTTTPDSPAYVLYTSGSTGKPKGIKHTTAGYNLYAKKTFEWVFDHRDDDIYWCTADCGWGTGHQLLLGVLAPRGQWRRRLGFRQKCCRDPRD